MSKKFRINYLILFSIITLIIIIPSANAVVWDKQESISEPDDVFIPSHEYVGFFDSNEIYTVVGNVKNNLGYSIIPTVTISVMDDSQKFTRTIQLTPLFSENEIPFKIQFPEITNTLPFLEPAKISYQKTITNKILIDVIYDGTLIVHDDGHLTGRIINSGTETISDVEILAIIHGYNDETLDMGKSVLPITNFKPGEIREFSMYPDPSVTDDVWYYSCFAIGTDTVIVLNTQRNGETFDIRYDSGILVSYPEFDESGKELSFWLNKGWPLPEYFINFEFPRYSDDEKFQIFLEKKSIKSIQSMDEWGNWHVSFYLQEQADGNLVVKGFDPNVTSPEQFIPEWIKYDANLWSQGLLSDEEFLTGIISMVNYRVIEISMENN
ncbi:MAG: peptidase, partial [Nitrosopumilus sp.]